MLDEKPVEMLRRQRDRAAGPTMSAPLLEQLAFLGEDARIETPPALSILNWVNYVAELARGNAEAALPHLTRFINTDLLEDPPAVFTQKFHDRPLQHERLRAVRERATSSR